MSLLITCDAGGWKTPSRLRGRLENTPLAMSVKPQSVISMIRHDEPAGRSAERLRNRGIDREANLAARKLARFSGGVLICNEYRADLIDVGRSLHHRDVFPAVARRLPQETREAIIEEIYMPYRNRVERQIEEMLRVWSYIVHVSVKTFDAKNASGHWRRGDVGLLYDPQRSEEVDWCLDLIDELYETIDELRVRRNHPHRGTKDSLPKSMRTRFSPDVYLGVEITLNRAWASRPIVRRENVLDRIGQAIGALTEASIERAA